MQDGDPLSTDCRIPYGMRGLKYRREVQQCAAQVSHPIRDAWIDISLSRPYPTRTGGRIPYGMRGLKLTHDTLPATGMSRIPYGMRGLKFVP